MTLLIALAVLGTLALGYLLWAGADSVTAEFRFGANGTYTKDLPNRSAFESFQLGQNNMPSLDRTYSTGSGTDQVQKYAVTKYTIGAGANQDVDLAGVLVDDLGTTVTFAVVKELLVILDSPDGAKKVRVGPQGVVNAWQGPHGGVVAGNYIETFDYVHFTHRYAGWTVTPGTGDILRINNSGAGGVDVHVIILGA